MDKVWGLRVACWDVSPATACGFVTLKGQIIDKFEIGFFPIPWMGHLELHFRLFEGSRP